MLVTEGTEDERSTVRVLDRDDEEVARTDDCPGVHGEAVAAGEAVVIGCEDGVVVWSGGELRKIDSPDEYGRIGNQAGSEVSPVVLGDYRSDPDAKLERPTRVSLVDTTTGSLRLVDLPASYTFRSLGRGDAGEALVLGSDGALHAVDVETGEVWASVDLGVTPNEIAGASGEAEAGAEPLPEDEAGDEHSHDETTGSTSWSPSTRCSSWPSRSAATGWWWPAWCPPGVTPTTWSSPEPRSRSWKWPTSSSMSAADRSRPPTTRWRSLRPSRWLDLHGVESRVCGCGRSRRPHLWWSTSDRQ
jgi:hypothetical protein